jgi:hypothetical protein
VTQLLKNGEWKKTSGVAVPSAVLGVLLALVVNAYLPASNSATGGGTNAVIRLQEHMTAVKKDIDSWRDSHQRELDTLRQTFTDKVDGLKEQLSRLEDKVDRLLRRSN